MTRTDHLSLVAEAQDRDVVAVGSVLLDGKTSGELVLLVEDRWQGKGIGSQLIDRLQIASEAAGITTITAQVLTTNVRVHRIIARACPQVTFSTPDCGVVEAVISLTGPVGSAHRPAAA
ncbi:MULTISPECIES: GNAT family N-acetyltransferase [Amycolatopsis]|uniref:GNAT family N-acetyltransferase n=1 Tax=Amycolatopsis albidoflavus TaxID=102226 RepID=A0ABW5I7K4_9PSEU